MRNKPLIQASQIPLTEHNIFFFTSHFNAPGLHCSYSPHSTTISCSSTCGARLGSLGEVWARTVTEKSKCTGQAAAQTAMKSGNRSSWRMYSLFSQLLPILTHYTSASPACLMLSENFSILEDWSSSNIHTVETSTLIQNNPPIPWKPRLKTILFIHFHNHICIRRPIFSLKFETCG